jgi:multidrug efflux pump
VFNLNRDINGAARDVQAAIQAARADLPTTLRSNPTYRQYNPSSAPIIMLALTSATRLTKASSTTPSDSVIPAASSQIDGVGADRRSAAAPCPRCASRSSRAS